MPDRDDPEGTETATSAPTPPSPASTSPEPSEAVTTVIPHVTRAAPTRVGPGLRAPGSATAGVSAAPTRIPDPAPRRRRRLWPLVVAAVAVVAALVAGGALFLGRATGDSPETRVTAAITDFVAALGRGDLAALRAGSCGELGTYYQQVGDAGFTDVYRSASAEQTVPVLVGVDAVAITDDTALAQVTVHAAGSPGETSVRSFALEQQGGVWKVCS
ncbi:hypothetical protein ACFYVR_07660 [Rhodococcus sp. NPDC003318]|uniref:Rv0361 family membrane protein n=1 Tax=Rhodococcus sp. NPDC003318 TaxID=3364503 RepID=UPI0036B883FE